MRYQKVHVQNRTVGESAPELKRQREVGKLPVVLSRHGETVQLLVSSDELAKAVRKSGVGGVMELIEEDDKKHLGILKELQWHPVSRKLQHASFQEVKSNEVVNTTVPIAFVGEPKSIQDRSGQFIKNIEAIELHGKVVSLPDYVGVDIGNLEIGDVVTCADLVMPEGVEPVVPDMVVCSLTTMTVPVLEAEEPVEGEVALVGEEGEASESAEEPAQE